MRGEKSSPKAGGVLYVVATPIGNMEDLTLRALRILKEVSVIVCEDTRQTRKILNKFNIKKVLLSYYHPKEVQKIPQIMNQLKKGNNVALVSDAGTPGISDPGFPLIREAIACGIEVIPIPGVSALTTALSTAGLPTHRFLFLGYPPPKKEAAKKFLYSLQDEKGTLVFYLPTRKIQAFLQLIHEVLGERKVVIAREMTKIHEEFLRGTAVELSKILKGKNIRGEATILIKGSK
jgi:16S rRNA (cytidine1402-2'-O)-methyltransferase